MEWRGLFHRFSALSPPSPCLLCPGNYDFFCQGPLRGFPRPSRSIHFGDVTEENGWTTWHETYWPRGIMRLRGPGNDFPKLSWLLTKTSELYTYDRRVRLENSLRRSRRWNGNYALGFGIFKQTGLVEVLKMDPHCTSSEHRKHQLNDYAADWTLTHKLVHLSL